MKDRRELCSRRFYGLNSSKLGRVRGRHQLCNREGQRVARIGRVMVERIDHPLTTLKLGEVGVGLMAAVHDGEDQPIGKRQRRLIEGRTAADHRLVGTVILARAAQCVLEIMKDLGTFRLIALVMREHEVRTAGERTSQRFKGLSTQDHRTAERAAFEMRKVSGKTPQKIVLSANGHPLIERGNEHDLHTQTAIGALILGCDS